MWSSLFKRFASFPSSAVKSWALPVAVLCRAMCVVMLPELWKFSSCCPLLVAIRTALGAKRQLRPWAPEVGGAALARGMRGAILPAGPGRSSTGGRWHPGAAAARSPWMAVTYCLTDCSKSLCTDTQALRVNCCWCHSCSLLYLSFWSSSLLWAWSLLARPSSGASGERGTRRGLQCRIAALG